MSETSDSAGAHLRAEKPEFLTEQRFEEFDLPKPLQSALKDAGFVHCTPIQEQTLPISLSGLDVAGQAQTGTGKTAAFPVTVITRILAFSDRDPRLPDQLLSTRGPGPSRTRPFSEGKRASPRPSRAPARLWAAFVLSGSGG